MKSKIALTIKNTKNICFDFLKYFGKVNLYFLIHYFPSMKNSRTTNIAQYIVLWLWLLFGVSRLFYFIHSNIPLWYDPGMYKEIFSHYRNVISSFDFSVLPQRIRHEPLLGILAGLINKLWVSFDWMVTR